MHQRSDCSVLFGTVTDFPVPRIEAVFLDCSMRSEIGYVPGQQEGLSLP